MFEAVLIGLVLAVLSPIAARYASRWTNQDRRERAFRRITAEPYYQPGMHFLRVELQGHPKPIMGKGRVKSVHVGRVVLRGERGEIVVVTGEELERLWIVSAPQYVVTDKRTGQKTIMLDDEFHIAQGRGTLGPNVEVARP